MWEALGKIIFPICNWWLLITWLNLLTSRWTKFKQMSVMWQSYQRYCRQLLKYLSFWCWHRLKSFWLGWKTFLLLQLLLNKHWHLFGLRAGDLKLRQEEHRFSSLIIDFGVEKNLVLCAHRQILASQEFSGLLGSAMVTFAVVVNGVSMLNIIWDILFGWNQSFRKAINGETTLNPWKIWLVQLKWECHTEIGLGLFQVLPDV